MEYEKQTPFIKELIANAQNDILKQSIRFPETWDGIELRWYIADRFSEVVFSTLGQRKGKRYNDFKNEVLVNNL